MSSPNPSLPSPPPPPPPTRKVPPPCWTHDETLALIEAYKDRYLALRRGYLRTPDWDAVSSSVSTKSSAQCRHKIEKLRQRYRAEKQKSLSIKGKFLSSWVLFKNLDFLDDGSYSNSIITNNNGNKKLENKNGFGINNSNLDDEFGNESDDDDGFVEKSLGDHDLLPIGYIESNYDKNDGSFQSPNFDYGSEEFRPKKYAKIDGLDGGIGLYNNRSSVPPNRFRSRKHSDMSMKSNNGFGFDQVTGNGSGFRGGFRGDLSGDWSSGRPGLRPRNYGSVEGNSNSNVDYSSLNGYSSLSRLKFAKKSDGCGIKGEVDPFGELVSSIKVLGEGFLKMEKMKMDMAMEFEKKRMEMDMKRSEMLLESQRQTVDACLKIFMAKKDTVKMEVSPET